VRGGDVLVEHTPFLGGIGVHRLGNFFVVIG
jgi:hypothetical protein